MLFVSYIKYRIVNVWKFAISNRQPFSLMISNILDKGKKTKLNKNLNSLGYLGFSLNSSNYDKTIDN